MAGDKTANIIAQFEQMVFECAGDMARRNGFTEEQATSRDFLKNQGLLHAARHMVRFEPAQGE
jgi:hypothetical protein